MKCVICHGNDIRETLVNEEVQHGNDVVLVPVTALKCSQCGERYYDQKTVRYLERIRHDIESNSAGDMKEVGRVLMYEDVAQAA